MNIYCTIAIVVDRVLVLLHELLFRYHLHIGYFDDEYHWFLLLVHLNYLYVEMNHDLLDVYHDHGEIVTFYFYALDHVLTGGVADGNAWIVRNDDAEMESAIPQHATLQVTVEGYLAVPTTLK
jgi:hypothetical protein